MVPVRKINLFKDLEFCLSVMRESPEHGGTSGFSINFSLALILMEFPDIKKKKEEIICMMKTMSWSDCADTQHSCSKCSLLKKY